MSDEFNLSGYCKLLRAFIESGYTSRSFQDAEPDSPHLILRHDLDFSLHLAEGVAEIENELGCSATYFVLTTSDFYNVRSPASVAALHRLQALGHTIGLHFDPMSHGGDQHDLRSRIERDADVLSGILGGPPLDTVSFHRPGERTSDVGQSFPGFVNAYEPKFFQNMGYCSDSRGRWRYQHPLDHPAVRDRRALQLLTHPIWWTVEGADATDKLRNFASGVAQATLERIRENTVQEIAPL